MSLRRQYKRSALCPGYWFLSPTHAFTQCILAYCNIDFGRPLFPRANENTQPLPLIFHTDTPSKSPQLLQNALLDRRRFPLGRCLRRPGRR